MYFLLVVRFELLSIQWVLSSIWPI